MRKQFLIVIRFLLAAQLKFVNISKGKNAFIEQCGKVPEEVVKEMNHITKEKQDAKVAKRKMDVLDKAANIKVSKISHNYSTIVAFNDEQQTNCGPVSSPGILQRWNSILHQFASRGFGED